MAVTIHPTALVDPKAQLDDGVDIGPFCIVGPEAKLHKGVKLISQVNVVGDTTIGAESVMHPFVSLGYAPQDFKHKGGPVGIKIGERCIFREQVTVHPGTDVGKKYTIIGNDCYLMVGAHVAHECDIGNSVTMSNYVQVGGSVTIGDNVIMGGVSAVHQFTRIGKHAFVGAMAWVNTDVIPYGSVVGNAARLGGLNVIGLKRRGFSRATIHDLRSAYRLLFAQEGTFAERLNDTERLYGDHEGVMDIVNFIRTQDKRNICMPH